MDQLSAESGLKYVQRHTLTGAHVWKVDPKTGYKYIPSVGTGLTLEKKIKLVELIRKCWPNVTQARKELDIPINAYRKHLAYDSKFAQDIEDIKEELVDKIEGVMAEQAQSGPKGFLDRIAFLRAHRRDLYGTRATVDVNVHNVSRDELGTKLSKMTDVFDAELVQEIRPPN